jgi:hypothetical protein
MITFCRVLLTSMGVFAAVVIGVGLFAIVYSCLLLVY